MQPQPLPYCNATNGVRRTTDSNMCFATHTLTNLPLHKWSMTTQQSTFNLPYSAQLLRFVYIVIDVSALYCMSNANSLCFVCVILKSVEVAVFLYQMKKRLSKAALLSKAATKQLTWIMENRFEAIWICFITGFEIVLKNSMKNLHYSAQKNEKKKRFPSAVKTLLIWNTKNLSIQ